MENQVSPVPLPGCKSLTQRALLLAATAEGETRLIGCNGGDDSESLKECLIALGVEMREEGGALLVKGLAGPLVADGVRLDVREGASTFRFLVTQVAAGGGEAIFCGSPRLMERPHEGLFNCLRAKGATIEFEYEKGEKVLRVISSGIKGGDISLENSSSSQYLSSLLLVPWQNKALIHAAALKASRGYIDLTLEAVARFRGVGSVVPFAEGWCVQPGVGEGSVWNLPGDASAATFFVAGLLVNGGDLVYSVPPDPSHPESRLARDLVGMGFLVVTEDVICAPESFPKKRLELNLDYCPDAGPALAVACAFLPGGGRLTGLHRLKDKESDRLRGMQNLVAAVGGRAVLEGEALVISGSTSSSVAESLDTAGDHRMAMAGGIAQLRFPNLEIKTPECVTKSFPGFWSTFKKWRNE